MRRMQFNLLTSRVTKIPAFKGSLPARPLYIYLPPGYDDSPHTPYPVLYMHDGQNAFEAYAADSFIGVTWQADLTADRLIAAGEIRPLIIVGIGNGSHLRTAEYLPPYITLFSKGKREKLHHPLPGRADQTIAYYIREVAPFIEASYRAIPDRAHRATCGSSMGGLMSNLIAWEYPEFASGHAILSPAYWLTYNQEGGLEMLERMSYMDPPEDTRIWLDSGTQDRPGEGDDGLAQTLKAREIMLAKGFEPGVNFSFFRDEGACHTESAWAGRMPEILKFLFPA